MSNFPNCWKNTKTLRNIHSDNSSTLIVRCSEHRVVACRSFHVAAGRISRRGGSYFPSLHGGSVHCDRFDVRDILRRRQYYFRFSRTRIYNFRPRFIYAASRSPYGRDGRRASLFFYCVPFFAAARSYLNRANQRRARSSPFTWGARL